MTSIFQKELVSKIGQQIDNNIKIELKWVPVAPFGLIAMHPGSFLNYSMSLGTMFCQKTKRGTKLLVSVTLG